MGNNQGPLLPLIKENISLETGNHGDRKTRPSDVSGSNAARFDPFRKAFSDPVSDTLQIRPSKFSLPQSFEGVTFVSHSGSDKFDFVLQSVPDNLTSEVPPLPAEKMAPVSYIRVSSPGDTEYDMPVQVIDRQKFIDQDWLDKEGACAARIDADEKVIRDVSRVGPASLKDNPHTRTGLLSKGKGGGWKQLGSEGRELQEKNKERYKVPSGAMTDDNIKKHLAEMIKAEERDMDNGEIWAEVERVERGLKVIRRCFPRGRSKEAKAGWYELTQDEQQEAMQDYDTWSKARTAWAAIVRRGKRDKEEKQVEAYKDNQHIQFSGDFRSADLSTLPDTDTQEVFAPVSPDSGFYDFSGMSAGDAVVNTWGASNMSVGPAFDLCEMELALGGSNADAASQYDLLRNTAIRLQLPEEAWPIRDEYNFNAAVDVGVSSGGPAYGMPAVALSQGGLFTTGEYPHQLPDQSDVVGASDEYVAPPRKKNLQKPRPVPGTNNLRKLLPGSARAEAIIPTTDDGKRVLIPRAPARKMRREPGGHPPVPSGSVTDKEIMKVLREKIEEKKSRRTAAEIEEELNKIEKGYRLHVAITANISREGKKGDNKRKDDESNTNKKRKSKYDFDKLTRKEIKDAEAYAKKWNDARSVIKKRIKQKGLNGSHNVDQSTINGSHNVDQSTINGSHNVDQSMIDVYHNVDQSTIDASHNVDQSTIDAPTDLITFRNQDPMWYEPPEDSTGPDDILMEDDDRIARAALMTFQRRFM